MQWVKAVPIVPTNINEWFEAHPLKTKLYMMGLLCSPRWALLWAWMFDETLGSICCSYTLQSTRYVPVCAVACGFIARRLAAVLEAAVQRTRHTTRHTDVSGFGAAVGTALGAGSLCFYVLLSSFVLLRVHYLHQ